MTQLLTRISLVVLATIPLHAYANGSSSELDQNLKPEFSATTAEEDIPAIFKEMGVVQRKAMIKSGKVLFSNNIAMDFSDGPYSMYGIHTNIGYALSDFWEIYLNLAPAYLNNKRSIVKKVESLQLADNQQATITAALPKREYGLELLWAPLYGKDSLGIRSIIRSDTFLKVGFSSIDYSGPTGMKFHVGVGKTYFIGRMAGLRVTASVNYMETIVDGLKSFSPALVLETGYVLYLF